MTEDEDRPAPDDERERRIDQVVSTIARPLGRQGCPRRLRAAASRQRQPPARGRAGPTTE